MNIAYESGLAPGSLRKIVCRVLRIAPDPNNWSPFPNVDNEVREHLNDCEWYHVYDVIEEIHNSLSTSGVVTPRGGGFGSGELFCR